MQYQGCQESKRYVKQGQAGDENKISNVKTKLFLKQWSKYIPNMGKDVSCEEAIYDIIDAIYKKIQLNRTDRSLEVITTITVPVAFSEVQKKKLKDICQKVGFTVAFCSVIVRRTG